MSTGITVIGITFVDDFMILSPTRHNALIYVTIIYKRSTAKSLIAVQGDYLIDRLGLVDMYI